MHRKQIESVCVGRGGGGLAISETKTPPPPKRGKIMFANPQNPNPWVGGVTAVHCKNLLILLR